MKYEKCETCKKDLFPVGEPRPEGVVMNQQIPISESTYTCEKCYNKPIICRTCGEETPAYFWGKSCIHCVMTAVVKQK